MTERTCAYLDSMNESDVHSSMVGVGVAHARATPTACTQDLLHAARQAAATCFENLPTAVRAQCAQSAVAGVRRILSALHTQVGGTASADNALRDISAQVEHRFALQLPLCCTVIVRMHGRVTDTHEVNYKELVSLCVLSELAERLSIVYPFGIKVSILIDDGTSQQEVPVRAEEQVKLQHSIRRWCAVADSAQRLEVCAIDSYHGAKLRRIWRELAAELSAGYFQGDSGVVAMLEEFLAAYSPRALREEEDERRGRVASKDDVRDGELGCKVDEHIRTGLSHLAHYQAREWLGIMDLTLPSTIWQISRGLAAA